MQLLASCRTLPRCQRRKSKQKMVLSLVGALAAKLTRSHCDIHCNKQPPSRIWIVLCSLHRPSVQLHAQRLQRTQHSPRTSCRSTCRRPCQPGAEHACPLLSPCSCPQTEALMLMSTQTSDTDADWPLHAAAQFSPPCTRYSGRPHQVPDVPRGSFCHASCRRLTLDTAETPIPMEQSKEGAASNCCFEIEASGAREAESVRPVLPKHR